MTTEPVLRHLFDLGDLSQAGSNVTVEAGPEELPSLAEWAGVEQVVAFRGAVALKRLSSSRFQFEADLTADIVQACVVTLEPVPAHIERHIVRELHLAAQPRRGARSAADEVSEGELTLSAGDDDVPEMIVSLDYDLAAPLLEELALAIDPYPRKNGVAFEAPADEAGKAENPFAVLKRLKDSQ